MDIIGFLEERVRNISSEAEKSAAHHNSLVGALREAQYLLEMARKELDPPGRKLEVEAKDGKREDN